MDTYEYATDSALGRRWTTEFSPYANTHFYSNSVEELLANGASLLKDMIHDFNTLQVPRLKVLESYCNARNYGISNRPGRTERDKADTRIKHNFGGLIAMFHTGYLFGIPVKITADTEQEQTVLDDINLLNSIDNHNAKLAFDCARYGRAYELHYRNFRDQDRLVVSDALDTFCIYSTDVERQRTAAVRLIRNRRKGKDYITVTLYTNDRIVTFAQTPTDRVRLTVEKEETHSYGVVPVVEWSNGLLRLGSFEAQITNIDAYDAAQSDTSNYMHDLNDALLVIKGNLDSAGLDADKAKKMKDANILLLEYGKGINGEPLGLDAGYIYKQYDVAGTEAYKTRLQRDIHKFSSTPDFNDENLSSTQSGKAMQYKLIGADQEAAFRIQGFTAAIQERYAVIDSLHSALSEPHIDAAKIKVEFTENTPTDYWADVQAYIEAGGELSKETLITLLPWVGTYREKLKRLNAERSVGSETDEHDHEWHS